MKKTAGLLILAVAISLMACKNEKETDKGTAIGALYLSEATPQPGDSLKLKYTTKDTDVPEAYYRYTVGSKSYPVDIDLKKDSTEYKGMIAIPDSATAVAFNFKIGEEYDNNNEKGYVIPLYNEEGQIMPGSHASMGYYYLTQGQRFGIKMEKDSAIALITKDLDQNANLRASWDRSYPRFLLGQDKEKGQAYIHQRIDLYKGKNELSENEYQTMGMLYNVAGEKGAADSILKVAAGKFPNGAAAKQLLFADFYKEKDLAKKEQMLADYTGNGLVKDRMLSMIAGEYAKKKDYDSFLKYAEQISDKSNIISLYNNVAWAQAEKGENLDLAAKLSKKSLDILKEKEHNLDDKPFYYSKNQYKKSLEGTYGMYSDTYGLILYKQGKIKEALKYQRIALGENKNGGPELNERYVQFLLEDKQYKEVEKEASRFISNDWATQKIKTYLEKAYVADKGSKEGFDGYLQGLEKQAKEKALEEINKKMVDEESYPFTLKNLKGEEVSLANLKGKTVILDFWATWCGPCKASFPGMQVAVDKYKDNPNVVFLFLDTWEQGSFEKRQKNVTDFINKNKYSFNVLYDMPVKEGSQEYVTTADYGITGIPTKIIIGPDGKVKFKLVGYNGSSEKLVQELDIIIGLLDA